MLLSDCVEYGTVKHPQRMAVVFEGEETTYATLNSRIHRVANAVLMLAAPGDRIAILSENRREYVECLYGVPRSGAGLCLLNYRLSDFELRRIINDAQPSVVIVEAKHLGTIENIRDETPTVKTVIVFGVSSHDDVIGYEDLLAGASDEEPSNSVDENELAWLIYTSGTTGMPKGAMLSHRNIVAGNSNTFAAWNSRPGKVLLAPWPMCHVAAQIWPLAHLLGWTVVLMRTFDAVEYLSAIERYHCTSSMGAPTMISMLINHPRFHDFDLSSLRTLSYGSSSMSPAVLREAMELLPNVGFATNFGMTETSGSVYYLDTDDHVRVLQTNPEALKSVGFQLPYSVSRLVDDSMNDVAPGDVGEIVVRGPMVMLGYWRNPQANEEAFRGGWFHTGDLARADSDGRTYIVDRKKDMIITGGLNVYSREVELILSTHYAVQEVAIVGIPDDTWGESIVAFVQPREGMSIDGDELIEYCRAHLAHFKKPKYVVEIHELPRNALGKVLKRELRDKIERGEYRLGGS